MGKKTDDYFTSIKVSTLTKWMIGGGIALLVIGYLIPDEGEFWVWKLASSLLEPVGTTLFSAGIVSVVVEISTIKNVVKTALNDILSGDFSLETFSKERLDKLSIRIASKRCGKDVDENYILDSLYILEPKMLESVSGMYYKKHKALYKIKPSSKRGVFVKRVELDYEIINPFELENQVIQRIQLYNITENMSDEERKKKFKILKFKINNTDLTSEADTYKTVLEIPDKSQTSYHYMVEFKRKLQKCRSHKIKLHFEYEVPITDVTQIYKLKYPSKHLEHEVIIETDRDTKEEWKVQGNAFTAFYLNQDDTDSGFSMEQKSDNILKVNFNNWCVPGTGYVLYYSKNI